MMQERFPHDAAYKTFFSDPEMVASLVRNFVPEPFVADMDFGTLERHATGHVTDDLRERHNDIVWRVRLKDSHCYLLLLLEFQSREDWWMAVRILSYTALLWEDLIRAGTIRAGDRLPPVFPLVLYNGGKKWEAPTRLSDLLYPLGGPLASYQPSQRYFLLEVIS